MNFRKVEVASFFEVFDQFVVYEVVPFLAFTLSLSSRPVLHRFQLFVSLRIQLLLASFTLLRDLFASPELAKDILGPAKAPQSIVHKAQRFLAVGFVL